MEYEIEISALIHAIEDKAGFARGYLEELTSAELDRLADALDKLSAVADEVAISRMEHNR